MNIADIAAIVNGAGGSGGAGGGSGGYDIILDCGDDFYAAVSNFTVKWDFAKIKQKVLNGEIVTGYAFRHYNYDEAVDGDTCFEIYPLTNIYIYSGHDDGSLLFRAAQPTGWDSSSNTVYVNFAELRVYFDSETGEWRSSTYFGQQKPIV